MSNLQQFMKKNKVIKENEMYAATKSLLNDKGEALLWEIRPISTKENEQLQKDSMVAQVNKKTGQKLERLDTAKYGRSLAVASVVFPDLYNKELQDSYDVTKPDDLLMELIDEAGEYADFIEFIYEFNGFTEMEDEVEEAKN